MYVADIAGRRALYSPDQLAVVDAGKVPHQLFTYAQLNERANRLANWLRDQVGVRKGDRVGIVGFDGVQYLDAFFACGKLGAILTCFNWRLHWRELLALIEQTTPKALIFSQEVGDKVAEITASYLAPLKLLHIEGSSVAGSRQFEATLQSAPADPVTTENVEAEDTACMLFTGGTTGLPKAAMISHRMIAWNTLNTVIHDVQHGDVTVNVFPMFHAGGLLVYTMPLMIFGGTTVLIRRFDAGQVLNLLQQYRATIFAGVPTMYQMLTTAPNWDSADLSNLRFCTSGGAPLPIALVEKFSAEKGVRFKQGFGMTEFGPGIFALAAEDAIRKAGSIGRPNFFVDARIVDEHNQPLPDNAVGELILKAGSMFSGYFQNAEASATAIDAQGWFHTGDLARRDEEGYFFIVDRVKDMYISGGENVYPAEVEQALYRHPSVHMCAVIGVPEPTWGEVGKAFVVLKAGTSASADDLIDFLRTRLARFKVPQSVEFIDALPISAAGKILKRELRERVTARGEK
ncbi:MAG: long-chain fatty acid--CoA ligase [Anaerolineae bacterium]|nr:long-chain fatty acid--CoA ligase [Anaerolineae bacterium]